jgi:hypothetical protein
VNDGSICRCLSADTPTLQRHCIGGQTPDIAISDYYCGAIDLSVVVMVPVTGASGRHGVAAATVPVTFSTFFTSLRIPNPEMTSVAPRMTSQAPTTRANVSIESNG